MSVVIPTYRRQAKLRRAVDSVLDQTYENIEVIVVNDDPETHVRDPLPSDGRLHVVHHSENRGAPAARNTGIAAASGEFIAFLDDDDEWLPRKLERQLQHFQTLPDRFGIVYTWTAMVEDGEVVGHIRSTERGDIFQRLLHRNVIPSETPVVRNECFDVVGKFDTDFRSNQDLDMWLRIAREYDVDYVPKILATSYKGNPDRISRDYERKYHGEKRLLEKYDSELEDQPTARARRLRELGGYALQTGRKTDGRDHIRSALRVGGFHPLTAAYFVVATLPAPFDKYLLRFTEQLVGSAAVRKLYKAIESLIPAS